MRNTKNIEWKNYANYIVIGLLTLVFGIMSLTGSISISNIYLLEKIAISVILAVSLSMVVGFVFFKEKATLKKLLMPWIIIAVQSDSVLTVTKPKRSPTKKVNKNCINEACISEKINADIIIANPSPHFRKTPSNTPRIINSSSNAGKTAVDKKTNKKKKEKIHPKKILKELKTDIFVLKDVL